MSEPIAVSVTTTEVAGWTIYRPSGRPAYAVDPTDSRVEVAWFNGSLRIADREAYYPSGHYDVPLEVIEALREMAK